jgi:hypothetical protein
MHTLYRVASRAVAKEIPDVADAKERGGTSNGCGGADGIAPG